MVTPGTYKAKVLSHGISEVKSSGNLQAVVKFEFDANNSKHQITWFGSFSEKARPFTLQGLVACGLKGSNPANDLEIGKEVFLVIENDTDEEGKVRNKVRWVNAIGAIKNAVSSDLAKSKLAQLEAEVIMARNKLGVEDPDDKIPF